MKRFPVLTATVIIGLLCAGCVGRGAEPVRDGAARTPTTTRPTAPKLPSAKAIAAGGNLLNAAESELIAQRYFSVAPGETKKVPIAFEETPLGSVIVLTDKPKGLKASLGGEPLQTGDLFGLQTLFLNVVDPAPMTLTLENTGTTRAAASLDVRIETSRTIEVDAVARAAAPGEAVTLTATVTDPTAEDVVHIRVSRDRKLVAELTPQRVSEGEWRAAFTPRQTGWYVAAARVDGGPPRFTTGAEGFSVGDRGTRVSGFEDRLIDSDGNGLAEYLAVRVHFVTSKPGQYMLTAVLGDQSRTPLAAGGGAAYARLEPGRHSFQLKWHAEQIQGVGVPGPWHVMHVQLVRIKPNYQTEADITDLGETKAHPLDAFERGPFR